MTIIIKNLPFQQLVKQFISKLQLLIFCCRNYQLDFGLTRTKLSTKNAKPSLFNPCKQFQSFGTGILYFCFCANFIYLLSMTTSFSCCGYFCDSSTDRVGNYERGQDRPDRISLRGIAPKPTATPKKLLKSLSSSNLDSLRQKHQRGLQSQSRIARQANLSRQSKLQPQTQRISRVSSQLDMHMSRIWKMREQLDVLKRN